MRSVVVTFACPIKRPISSRSIRAATRHIEQWLAEVDGRSEPVDSRKNACSDPTSRGTTGWYAKAVEAAGRIEPAHTSPSKLASTYALLSIAETLLIGQQTRPPGPDPAGAAGPQVMSGTVSERDAANMHVNQHFAWSRQGFESP